MTPADALRTVTAAGFRVELANTATRDGALRFTPKAAPVDVVALLREHKEGIADLLRKRRRLIDRLKGGQSWLDATSDGFLNMPELGVGSELEARYRRAFDLWPGLEAELRLLFPEYTDCIHGLGKTCWEHSTVRCSACARDAERRLL
ncbi:MAG: hypothetical protein WD533_06555 [Dehalococcoidia bacterium]